MNAHGFTVTFSPFQKYVNHPNGMKKMYKNFSFAPRVQNKSKQQFYIRKHLTPNLELQSCETPHKHNGSWSRADQQTEGCPSGHQASPSLLSHLFKNGQLSPLDRLQGSNTGDACCIISQQQGSEMTTMKQNNPKDVVHSGTWGPKIVFELHETFSQHSTSSVSSKHFAITRVGSHIPRRFCD